MPVSAKPEYGNGAIPHLERSFDDNLDGIRSAFPSFPKGMKWENKKRKRLTTIESENPLATATLFANLASAGFTREKNTDNGFRRWLSDGSVIGLRYVSSSDGSPAVDLNISSESFTRKIHFTLRRK